MNTLYEKTGSDSPLKEFTRMLRKAVKANALPDYHLEWIEHTESGSPAVHIIRRSCLSTDHPAYTFPVQKSALRPISA